VVCGRSSYNIASRGGRQQAAVPNGWLGLHGSWHCVQPSQTQQQPTTWHQPSDLHVEVFCTRGQGYLLGHRKKLLKLVVRHVCQFRTVVFRDHELKSRRISIKMPIMRKPLEATSLCTDSMAVAERIDVQKCEGLLALEYLH